MEKFLDDYPSIITIEKTETIIEQIKHSICKIYNDGTQGTGFFCKIMNRKGKKFRVFITNKFILFGNLFLSIKLEKI